MTSIYDREDGFDREDDNMTTDRDTLYENDDRVTLYDNDNEYDERTQNNEYDERTQNNKSVGEFDSAYKDVCEEKEKKCETNCGVIIFIAIMSTLVIGIGIALAVFSSSHSESDSDSLLLSAPSETIIEACSTASMKSPAGVKECKSNCIEANCCYVSITSENSCLEENNRVCDEYNSYCSIFYIVANENPGVIGVTTTMRTKTPAGGDGDGDGEKGSSTNPSANENDPTRQLQNNRLRRL